MDYKPWDLSGLTEKQRAIITRALDLTDFDFTVLLPGLVVQRSKTTIPVEFIDMAPYERRLDGSAHQHVHAGEDLGHPITRDIEGRRAVLGLAWYSGKVSVALRLEDQPDLAMEVFLAEGAHMVDFFYMTPEHREQIFAIYHVGDAAPHDHGWFEETGNDLYWSWVGESFMYGFIAAFSKVHGTNDSFIHRTTPEIGQRIRDVLVRPAPIVRRVRSTIYHRMGGWHERQIPDAMQEGLASEEAALALGFRRCKSCNWNV